MASLILVKHSIVTPDPDVPPKQWRLTTEGRERCRKLATALRSFKPEVIVSSDEPKATETAELLATRLKLGWHSEADLDEHRRPYEPELEFHASMQRFFAAPEERAFGDESAMEAHTRFAAAIESALAREPERNVVIVSHGTVIALYAAPYFQVGAAALWARLESPSFVVIDRETSRGAAIIDSLD
ncbi:MAG TPA: histidine phosphatase family protein [Dehalococcoidia bacterium]|nr:histidine phosphatase family protein [Dehalococcoidia bacterium]